MLSKEQVMTQYNTAMESIKSQDTLKKYLRVMALHPYTDFINVAVLMQNDITTGVYCKPGKHEGGHIITGLTFDPRISQMVVNDITYLDAPGPVFNRKAVEASYEIESVEYDGEFKLEENGPELTIYYPIEWDEGQKSEAFIKLIFDMFENKNLPSYIRDCVVYMTLIYAGFNAYLPTVTYKDIMGQVEKINTAMCLVNAHYQYIFRRIFGVVLTPLEIELTDNYQSYTKASGTMLECYKKSYELLFGERYRELFKLKIPYYPPENLDFLLW